MRKRNTSPRLSLMPTCWQVNKAQERQRIIEWARKRQPGQAIAAQVKVGAPIRVSASAPSLHPPSLPEASSCELPAIGGMAASTRQATKQRPSQARVNPSGAHRSDMWSAASQPTLHMKQAPRNAGAAHVPGSSNGTGAGKCAGHSRKMPSSNTAAGGLSRPSASVPGLPSSAPKDLGSAHLSEIQEPFLHNRGSVYLPHQL